MGLVKSLYRLFWVTEVTLFSILRFAVAVSGSGWTANLAAAHARRWAAALTRGLDIRVNLQGRLPDHSALVVSNHRSYLDIVVILSHMDAAFLAKAELKAWPVFGYAARKGNTVFVDRSSPESRAMARQALADRMDQGVSVVVFPEGTTTAGPGLLPFKNGIFHMAARKKIPVVPVSVVYKNPDAPWIGNDFFVPHFLKIFKTGPLKATLTVGPELTGMDGDSLKSAAHAHISGQLAALETPLPN